MTLDQFHRRITDAGTQWLASTRDPLDKCDDIMSSRIEQNFRRAATAENWKWPPRKDNLPHPLLIKSGLMMTAALYSVWYPDPQSVEHGVDLDKVPYARAQQKGRAEINLPPRPFLGVNEADLVAMEEAVADYAVETFLVEAGGGNG